MNAPHQPPHSHDCNCGHDHGHETPGNHLILRWLFGICFVIFLIFLLKPAIINQMYQRSVSYATYNSPTQVVRICQKILFLDQDNINTLTMMGLAYMDLNNDKQAKEAFLKVLKLQPQNRGMAAYGIGKILYMNKEYQEALGYFDRIKNSGQEAKKELEADILKFRHGRNIFRNMDGMTTMLGMMVDSYEKTGQMEKASNIEAEYIKAKANRRIL